MIEKSTKILATLGPASSNPKTIEGLIKAGANLFRLNFSHGTHEHHLETLKMIRAVMKKLDITIGVMQDISGPKVRIGDLEDKFELNRGDVVTFKQKEIVGYKKGKGQYVVSINYPKILKKMKVGESVYLYDGIIHAKVISIGKNVKVMIENHGILSSKKGVNFPHTEIGIDVLTQKDRDDIAWGVKNRVDFFAISFVQNANDIIRVRELLDGYGGKIISKIEKFDAIENIDEIIEVSDGIMVARGDLGIEVPYYKVPTLQKMLIRKANKKSIPVITATQMLLSMTTNTSATRAEVSDVANAVLDGTDIVMLSEESAIGNNPVHAVNTMSNIIAQTEKIYPYHKQKALGLLEKFDIIEKSVMNIADELKATGILILTSSGQSAIKISRFRPKTKIYAFTHNPDVLTQLTSIWGVTPVDQVEIVSASKMIKAMLKKLEKRGILDRKGLYISTIGYPLGVPGSTNTIKILNESEIDYYLSL